MGISNAAVPQPLPIPVPTKKANVGVVTFNTGKNIRVFWDNVLVDTAIPLKDQPVGEHALRFERSGYKPIETKVMVTDHEPVVINVK